MKIILWDYILRVRGGGKIPNYDDSKPKKVQYHHRSGVLFFAESQFWTSANMSFRAVASVVFFAMIEIWRVEGVDSPKKTLP